MGSYMILRVDMKRDDLAKFLIKAEESDVYFRVERMYDMDGEFCIISQVDYYGYAEPVMLYKAVKEVVKDIWYLCVEINQTVGRNKPTKWLSCKQEAKKG